MYRIVLYCQLQDCVALPHLLVVPLSVLPNWERELSIWAPYLTVVSLKGNAASRQLLLEHCLYAPAGTGRKSSLQVR
jgi:SNF2 family DNA or RNA helicase